MNAPCCSPFGRLAELHNPHQPGIPVQRPQEVHPRPQILPDPVASSQHTALAKGPDMRYYNNELIAKALSFSTEIEEVLT